MVHQYRVYRLDRANHVADVEWIAAGDDTEAVNSVRQTMSSCTRELWLGERLIATIEATAHEPPSAAYWL